MITRLYVNNFRSLVAFEIHFDSINVLCGYNGTGKSSVFDAIQFIASLASGNCFFGSEPDDYGRNISKLDFTNWMQSSTQEFEIDLIYKTFSFKYIIHLEQEENFIPRVKKELAICNGKELYTRDLDGVHFDNGRSGFPLDWHQAALASIQPVPERKEIELLQKAFSELLILRPDIHAFLLESKMESQKLNLSMNNFTSWYRYLYQNQEFSVALRDSLKAVWEDLKFLDLENAGMSVKILKLRFEKADFLFNQLSDGEKMLVCLYALQTALDLGFVNTVFIDEPDNFLSLQELQPWFLSMSELADENHQIIFISHSGEILNLNAAKKLYFSRDSHSSPSRVGELKVLNGMLPSEIIARGWGDIV